jgi:hypothetical protein
MTPPLSERGDVWSDSGGILAPPLCISQRAPEIRAIEADLRAPNQRDTPPRLCAAHDCQVQAALRSMLRSIPSRRRILVRDANVERWPSATLR